MIAKDSQWTADSLPLQWNQAICTTDADHGHGGRDIDPLPLEGDEEEEKREIVRQ